MPYYSVLTLLIAAPTLQRLRGPMYEHSGTCSTCREPPRNLRHHDGPFETAFHATGGFGNIIRVHSTTTLLGTKKTILGQGAENLFAQCPLPGFNWEGHKSLKASLGRTLMQLIKLLRRLNLPDPRFAARWAHRFPFSDRIWLSLGSCILHIVGVTVSCVAEKCDAQSGLQPAFFDIDLDNKTPSTSQNACSFVLCAGSSHGKPAHRPGLCIQYQTAASGFILARQANRRVIIL